MHDSTQIEVLKSTVAAAILCVPVGIGMAMLCAVICMATPGQGASAVCVCSSVTYSLCGVSNLCASCLCAMHPRQINTYIYS